MKKAIQILCVIVDLLVGTVATAEGIQPYYFEANSASAWRLGISAS
ncbi:MAG: hypothetical protein RR975_11940 [Clostridia bacterium]